MHCTVPCQSEAMTLQQAQSLYHAFAAIPDPRRRQGRRYPLAAILTLAVVAIVTQHGSVLAMAEWIADQSAALQRACGFDHGQTPHQTTIQRLLQRLTPSVVVPVLAQFFDPAQPGELRARGAQGVSCDGKSQRGRLAHADATSCVIHAISAYCHDSGLTIAQQPVDARQHEAELAVVPTLLAQVDWQGRVLTGDALYCQQHLCRQVVEAGGDYLLVVRENQPTLLADIQQVFAPLSAEERARTGVHTLHPLPEGCAHRVQKVHGRLEERSIRVSSELADYSRWPYLAQVFELTRIWEEQGVTKRQTLYGVTSLPAGVSDAGRLLALKQGHWGIENRSHYIRDVVLGEDASPMHVGHGPDVMALMRTFAINLIRRAGYQTIAARVRYYSRHPREALALVGIHVPENA